MLAETWYWLLALMLGTYVVLGGTDLGVGILQLYVARTRDERRAVIETIRPLWKPNEVWLVAAGGTLFLAFPTLLAVSFSGFYLPLMLVLWLLLARGLGIELRYQVEDAMWQQLWDVTLSVASLLLALCYGAALGNIVRGVPIAEDGTFFAALWTNFRVDDSPGILDWYTLLVGALAALALAHHGALWLASRASGAVRDRAARAAAKLLPALMVAFFAVTSASFIARPAVLDSLRARPVGLALPLLAIAAFAATRFLRRAGRSDRAYLASCVAFYASFLTAALSTFPNVLPARDPGYSLTIANAAAPDSGLATALWWWLPGMAIVIGCFAWVHRRIRASISAASTRG
jgi:cytochrome bd ubiquinol oxidase subunit II